MAGFMPWHASEQAIYPKELGDNVGIWLIPGSQGHVNPLCLPVLASSLESTLIKCGLYIERGRDKQDSIEKKKTLQNGMRSWEVTDIQVKPGSWDGPPQMQNTSALAEEYPVSLNSCTESRVNPMRSQVFSGHWKCQAGMVGITIGLLLRVSVDLGRTRLRAENTRHVIHGGRPESPAGAIMHDQAGG
ncbi:hypothetical protein PG993_001716 [Apiospora rasikravindrae]|uniref:Uncharacterized protein n=1 Tax=Apiospora rasikravindrae TaxID=990691 RepID=A0ABR1UC59_9PEZI